jgi:hypothetical protein
MVIILKIFKSRQPGIIWDTMEKAMTEIKRRNAYND